MMPSIMKNMLPVFSRGIGSCAMVGLSAIGYVPNWWGEYGLPNRMYLQ